MEKEKKERKKPDSEAVKGRPDLGEFFGLVFFLSFCINTTKRQGEGQLLSHVPGQLLFPIPRDLPPHLAEKHLSISVCYLQKMRQKKWMACYLLIFYEYYECYLWVLF